MDTKEIVQIIIKKSDRISDDLDTYPILVNQGWINDSIWWENQEANNLIVLGIYRRIIRTCWMLKNV